MLRSPTSRERCDSEPDIAAATAARDASPRSHITNRPKRRYNDVITDELTDFKNEIKSLITAFTRDQDAKLCAIQSSLAEIKKTNADIEKSMDFLSQQYESFKKTVNTLEEESKTNRFRLDNLQDKIEMLERAMRANKTEIRNLPGKEKENKAELLHHVNKLFSTLNCDMKPTDVIDLYRVQGKKDINRPVIVELSSSSAKNKVLQSARIYNKTHKDNKLNSGHAGIEGSPVPIYIAEQLSQTAAHIYYMARKLKLQGMIKHCWTSDGRVLVRKTDTSPVIQIKLESQLEQLKQIE